MPFEKGIQIFFVAGWCVCLLLMPLTFFGMVPVPVIFGVAAFTIFGTFIGHITMILISSARRSSSTKRNGVLEAPVVAQPVILNGDIEPGQQGNNGLIAAPVDCQQGLQPPAPIVAYKPQPPPYHHCINENEKRPQPTLRH